MKINIDGVDFNLEEIVLENYVAHISLLAVTKALHRSVIAYISAKEMSDTETNNLTAVCQKQFSSLLKEAQKDVFAQSRIPQSLADKFLKDYLDGIEGIAT